MTLSERQRNLIWQIACQWPNSTDINDAILEALDILDENLDDKEHCPICGNLGIRIIL